MKSEDELKLSMRGDDLYLDAMAHGRSVVGPIEGLAQRSGYTGSVLSEALSAVCDYAAALEAALGQANPHRPVWHGARVEEALDFTSSERQTDADEARYEAQCRRDGRES